MIGNRAGMTLEQLYIFLALFGRKAADAYSESLQNHFRKTEYCFMGGAGRGGGVSRGYRISGFGPFVIIQFNTDPDKFANYTPRPWRC
jgi:hypothetical protein